MPPTAVMDPLYTLLNCPPLLEAARALVKQRHEEWLAVYDLHHQARPLTWAELDPDVVRVRTRAVAEALRDLTRPESYDWAVRELGGLLGGPRGEPGWRIHTYGGASIHCKSAGWWALLHVHPSHDEREVVRIALSRAWGVPD